MKVKPIQPADHPVIIDMYVNKEYSVSKIANIYNLKTTYYIYQVLKEHGIPARGRYARKIDKDKHPEICRRYAEDKVSLKQLALDNGLSDTSTHIIRKILTENNIPIRTMSESAYLREKKVSDEKEEDIESYRDIINELYWEKNMNLAEVGRQLGKNLNKVRHWMVELGIPRRKPNHQRKEKCEISKEKLEELYVDKKLSGSEIAILLKVPESRVFANMRQHKIPRRDTSQATTISAKRRKELIVEKDLPKLIAAPSHLSIKDKIRYLRKEKNAKVQDIIESLRVPADVVYKICLELETQKAEPI